MKKYLFGLGAMLVGAGLMFVLMHGEVSAEGEAKKPEQFVCSEPQDFAPYLGILYHCETKTLDCARDNEGLSCVKKGLFK